MSCLANQPPPRPEVSRVMMNVLRNGQFTIPGPRLMERLDVGLFRADCVLPWQSFRRFLDRAFANVSDEEVAAVVFYDDKGRFQLIRSVSTGRVSGIRCMFGHSNRMQLSDAYVTVKVPPGRSSRCTSPMIVRKSRSGTSWNRM